MNEVLKINYETEQPTVSARRFNMNNFISKQHSRIGFRECASTDLRKEKTFAQK